MINRVTLRIVRLTYQLQITKTVVLNFIFRHGIYTTWIYRHSIQKSNLIRPQARSTEIPLFLYKFVKLLEFKQTIAVVFAHRCMHRPMLDQCRSKMLSTQLSLWNWDFGIMGSTSLFSACDMNYAASCTFFGAPVATL